MEIETTTYYEICRTKMNITHSIAQGPDLFVTNGSTTTIILKTNHVQQTCFITSQQSLVKKLSKQVKTQHTLNNFNGCLIGLHFLQNCIICRTTWTYCCRLSSIRPGYYTRKDEDGLLLEFPCNSTRTRSV
jgi:hypothetical protein